MLTADHAGFIKYWQSNMNNVKMFQAHKDPVRGLRWEPIRRALVTSHFVTMTTLLSPARVRSGDLGGFLCVLSVFAAFVVWCFLPWILLIFLVIVDKFLVAHSFLSCFSKEGPNLLRTKCLHLMTKGNFNLKVKLIHQKSFHIQIDINIYMKFQNSWYIIS